MRRELMRRSGHCVPAFKRLVNRTGSLLLTLLLTAVSGSAFSRDKSLNEMMQDVGDTMLEILPQVHQENPDRKLLGQALNRLAGQLEQAAPHFSGDQSERQVTLRLLLENLRQNSAEVAEVNMGFLRGDLNDTFELCAACHTQDQKTIPGFGISRIKALDDYLAGEFSFLTRDYGNALVSFTQVAKNKNADEQDRSRALGRILVITAEVYADVPLAVSTLSEVAPAFADQTPESGQIRAWIHALQSLAANPADRRSPLALETVTETSRWLSRDWPAIQAVLGWHEQTAYWVVIRGRLDRLLNKKLADKYQPELLYWLSVSDRQLHYQFYDSLSRRYLEQCMENWPDSPWATRCLEEYEMLVMVSWSGSGGTFVPPEVRERLGHYRRLINLREQQQK
ncbi:MAG: hypothetical protein KDI36_02855 [Pseudomonadales bacterium]|nr:hypothetical protein [Pseudomonadales bacterium]